jgi:hypothetical protein
MTLDVDKHPHCERDKETKQHEEIKITPEMVDAGRAALRIFDRDFEDDRDAIKRIYLAMRRAENPSKQKSTPVDDL